MGVDPSFRSQNLGWLVGSPAFPECVLINSIIQILHHNCLVSLLKSGCERNKKKPSPSTVPVTVGKITFKMWNSWGVWCTVIYSTIFTNVSTLYDFLYFFIPRGVDFPDESSLEGRLLQ